MTRVFLVVVVLRITVVDLPGCLTMMVRGAAVTTTTGTVAPGTGVAATTTVVLVVRPGPATTVVGPVSG